MMMLPAPPQHALSGVARNVDELVAAVIDRQQRRTDGFLRLNLLPTLDRAMAVSNRASC
jgi:hypothetical protein